MFTRRWLLSGGCCLILGLAGCAAGNGNAENDGREDEPGSDPAPARQDASRDVAGYPMPADPPGQDRVAGPVISAAHDPACGARGELVFTVAGDTLEVTVCDLAVNCCTERLAAGISDTGGGLSVVLYEYLPDVCECFHQRDVSFRLYPAPAPGTVVSVGTNDRPGPVASGDSP